MMKKGFTLIELLVAAGIFAMTMVFITMLASTSIKVVSQSVAAKSNNDAVRILNNKLGQIVSQANEGSCLPTNQSCTFDQANTDGSTSPVNVSLGNCAAGVIGGVCIEGVNILPTGVTLNPGSTIKWLTTDPNSTPYLDAKLTLTINPGQPTGSTFQYLTQFVSRR
jgi:prepilin-type N-terminal cleavage/methylation domain-containing protein